MNPFLDETHDPRLESWIESANSPETDFPVQNLPFGRGRRRGSEGSPRIFVAIGDLALDLAACMEEGLLPGLAPELAQACRAPSLNALMALDPRLVSSLRRTLSRFLRMDTPADPAARHSARKHLVPREDLELLLPAGIGDYTDFYASLHHATNVGTMFRPENPLASNYKYMPIAYHGRASSVVISGTPVRRPAGQIRTGAEDAVRFAPTRQLDYEAEMAFFVGAGNPLGERIPLESAPNHIFGLCILNDWSARDIQAWEARPLGPFLGKSFATTISPWVVTLEALAPFRVPALARSAGDPPLLSYLSSPGDRALGALDVIVEVSIATELMRRQGCSPILLSRANLRDIFWTFAQMVAYHTSNGCNLRPGDLLGSGTISGPERTSMGCLLERTRQGTQPFHLPTGETRTFLEDGDEIAMRARCESAGAARIGFGECTGIISSAVAG